MKNKGFTLTELLAVIAIIAILSVAAISGYSVMTNNSKEKTLKTKISAIENAAYKYAKENNIDKKTTISVNKLVAMGYLQADESSDEGLSIYSNPVSGENMICNTVELTIVNNDVVVKYNANKKNCSLANEEEDAAKIRVTAYCSTGADLTLAGDYFAWTSCDQVYLRTNPNTGINAGDIESISFDYDGNSIVKKTGTMAGSNTTASIEDKKNIVIVSGVNDQVVTTDVGITYTMKNGKVYFRHAIVRIDKQNPTLTYVLKNNTKIGPDGEQQRSLEVYVDDANGSGSSGFYVSRSENPGGATFEGTEYKKTISADLGVWHLIPKDKVGNIGKPIMTTVENVPGKLTCRFTLFKENRTTVVPFRNNNWYNQSIAVREDSDKYTNGVNYGILKGTPITNRSQLPLYADKNTIINHFFEPTQTSDMEIIKFYGGLWNVQNKAITVCTADVGIDTRQPTVDLNPKGATKHEKSHSVTVTITDPGTVVSGFYLDGKDHMIEGQLNYQLWYAWVPSSITSEASIPITKWSKANPTGVAGSKLSLNPNTTSKLTYTISEHKKDYNGTNMTGAYRLIIKSGTIQDLAGNYNTGAVSDIYKLDNTQPTCTNAGGSSEWTKGDVTITGSCTDQDGTTDQSGCATTASKTYSTNTNSTTESPGSVTDAAGNIGPCKADREVHIDKTEPSCSISDQDDYSTGGAGFKVSCTDSGNSGLTKCAGTTVSGNSGKSSKISGKKSGDTYYVYDAAKNSNSCTLEIKTSKKYIKKDQYHSKEVCTSSGGSHQAAGNWCGGYSASYGNCGSATIGTNGNYYCYCEQESCTTEEWYTCGSNYGGWGGTDTGCDSVTGYKAK